MNNTTDWVSRLEKKIGNFYVSNLTTKIIILKFCFLIALFWDKNAFQALVNPTVNYSFILSNIISFLAIPPSDLNNELSLIFLFFGFLIIYYCGASLESYWGSFRFNVYIFSGLLIVVLIAIIIKLVLGVGLNIVFTSADIVSLLLFLAYSIHFKDREILFFFVVPMKVFYLGIFLGIMLTLEFIAYLYQSIFLAFLYLSCFSGFFLFYFPFLINFIRRKKR